MPYPSHDINPKLKNDKWLCDHARAIWNEAAGTPNIFYNAAWKYEKIKSYVMGAQDTTPQLAKLQNKDGKSFLNLDRRPRPILSTYRDKAISKLQQREFNINATPIDALAKDDADKYYADAKVKILMRDALQQSNPELATSPVLQKEPQEAENLEELEMQMTYGWKHEMAIEAEEGFQLIAYQNNFEEQRRQTIINLYDYGAGGYKEWMDSRGNVKLRAVNPANIIINYCRHDDFRDATHIGEVVEVPLSDLSDKFSSAELKIISDNNSTQIGMQPSKRMRPDKSKITVLDLEFKSYDDIVFDQRIDSRGNLQYGRTDYGNKFKTDTKIIINGKEEPAYITRNIEKIYTVKWIIGTDYCYDAGPATNQKRDKNNKAATCFSYHLYAYNFYEMKAQSITDKLIPTIDEYQETVYRVQQFKSRWIPYVIDIDFDALESVALGKGGENMKPDEVLEMMFQIFVLPGRRRDQAGNPNYKAVDIRATPMANEFTVLVNDMIRLTNELGEISGYNDITSGSPNPKTLVPGYNLAVEATNLALFPITYAEKSLLERLAKGVVQRMQIAVKSGKVEGVIHALGSSSVKFISVSPDISLYVYGIKIEDKPTDQQKQMLLEKLNLKDAQGLVDPEDYVMIMNIDNLKQAQEMLAYRVKKRRQEDQQKAMQMQQMNGQIQVQSAQAAEQAKQQTLQVEYQLKTQLVQIEKEWDYKIAELKSNATVKAAEGTAGAKIVAQGMQHHADINKAAIEQGIPPGQLNQSQPSMPEQPGEQTGQEPSGEMAQGETPQQPEEPPMQQSMPVM